MENKQYRFGEIRAFDKKAVEESRTIDFVISDESKDRHGTVIDMKGWVLDPYNRNGIVGYQHNVYGGGMCDGPDPDMIIAKGLAIQEGNQLIGRTVFEPADLNLLAEKIFRKVIFGTLRSTSVGFNEMVKGMFGEGDQAQGQPNETYYFGKRELLEYSVVNIPSNRNAQVRSMRDHTAGALAYVNRELGGKYRLSQIENLRVCDVLDLLDGKDIDINTTDPDEVRRILAENSAKEATIQKLNDQLGRYQRIYNK